MNDFDKELERAFSERLNSREQAKNAYGNHRMNIIENGEKVYLEVVKQAVDKYVIGEQKPIEPHMTGHDPESMYYKGFATGYNTAAIEHRQALWGNTNEI